MNTCVYLCQVEVTKYEELEEAAAELKLKILLWDSLSQWDVTVAEWMEVQTMSFFVRELFVWLLIAVMSQWL